MGGDPVNRIHDQSSLLLFMDVAARVLDDDFAPSVASALICDKSIAANERLAHDAATVGGTPEAVTGLEPSRLQSVCCLPNCHGGC